MKVLSVCQLHRVYFINMAGVFFLSEFDVGSFIMEQFRNAMAISVFVVECLGFD